MIYANNHRFFPRNYQIDAESQFIPFQIDLENQVVTEIASAIGLNSESVIGIPLNKYLCKINYILSPKIIKNFFEVIS